jgi:hypothetical protein
MARGLNVFVNIGARVGSSVSSATSQTVRQFESMGRRIRLISAETSAHMAAADRRWGSIRQNASDFAWGVSAPMGGMALLGARTAYEWAQVGNNLQAVTQMTDEQRRAVERAARTQIGNPVDNLRAGLDLGRTGLRPDEIAQALPVAIKLARSDPDSVDQARAADIVTNVIKGMRMPVSQLGYAADILGYAAAQSSSDVRLMGESFKYAGPLAARAGIGMDEAAAAFMTMADAGIKGSESGVAFRSMLVRMIRPTRQAAGVLARYNMDMRDYVTMSNRVSGQSIVDTLRAGGVNAEGARSAIDRLLADPALSGADLVQRITDAVASGLEGGADAMDRELLAASVTDAVMAGADKIDFRKFIADAMARGWTTQDLVTFFDTRQGARIATLFGPEMEDALAKMRQEAGGATGFLDKMFALQNQGVVGSMQRLAQSIGNLVIVISETGVIDTAANAIDKLASGISALGRTNPGLLKFLTYSAIGLAVLGPLGFLLGGVASGLRVLGWAGQMAWRMLAPIMGPPMMAGLRMLGSGLMRLIGLSGPARGMFLALRIAAMAGLAPLLAIGWPVALAIGALGVAIAWLIAKRDGFVAFFQGMKQGIVETLGPENVEKIKAFGRGLKAALDLVTLPARLVADAIGDLFSWIGRLFAPAETEKWHAGGRSFGQAIGGMLNGVISFIEKIGEAITKMREFFSAGQGFSMGLGTVNPSLGTGAALAGAAISGRRQRGGSVYPGGVYQINERGQELFAPGHSGTIIPAGATAALIAAMSGAAPAAAAPSSPAAPVTVIVQGAGDPEAVADRVIRKLEARAARSARAGMHD